MSTFSRVYKPYPFGEGGCLWKSTFFPYTFNFLARFLLFSWWFLALKKCWCLFIFGGGGLRKCMVCTFMNMLTFMDSPLAKEHVCRNIVSGSWSCFVWLQATYVIVGPRWDIVCVTDTLGDSTKTGTHAILLCVVIYTLCLG